MARKSLQHSSFDLLWKEHFRDPSQWRDNRRSKVGFAYPDFKHNVTKESLWIAGCYNPSRLVEDLRRRGLVVSTQAHDGELFERTATVIPDECTTFVASLRACAKSKDLRRGTRLHNDVLKRGLLRTCLDALVTMYAKCGELEKAKDLLDMHKSRDVFSWTDVIAGYARKGHGQDALKCFEQMQDEGLFPDAVTFACIMKACGSIGAADKGEQIHDEISRRGLLRDDIVLGTAVIDMYAKCGALAKAARVLEELPVRNVVSWTALITAYAQQGQAEKALSCFEQMQHEGISPNAMTFVCILKACGSIGALDKGEQIYDEIARQGLLRNDIVLGTAVVDMYAKCGALANAARVLGKLRSRNHASWNALIAGYAQQGQGEQALNCFDWMQREGLSPNAVTFLCILKACGSIGAADKGEEIHEEMVRLGLLGNDIVLGNALVDMYAKCGALAKAEQVLEKLPVQDVVSWNALITGYAQQGQGEQALSCFKRMQHKGLSPDAVTLVCVLKACGIVGLVGHAQTYFVNMSTEYGIKPDLAHYTCMVDAFGRAGHLDKALGVIQKIPSFDYSSALWSAVLGACRKWGDKNVGRWAFEHALQVDKSDDALMTNIYEITGCRK